jgi:(1->4)-alpha-D-glucan 1-alpha-D-glucosylmutase
MSEVGEWLHDPQGEAPLTELWQQMSGSTRVFSELSRTARRQLIAQNFAGEFDTLSRLLHRLAQSDLMTRDWSLSAIRRVLTELLVFFPVYRTYADLDGRTENDEAPFATAMEGARSTVRTADYDVLDLLAAWLGGEVPSAYPEQQCQVRLQAIRRFQQLTSPLAAKSVEDTGFYRYGRLLSRNEVGSDPAAFALDSETLHRRTLARAKDFPQAMLATSTHDHKRGEDSRARLAVLSERHTEWATLVQAWNERHGGFKHVIHEQFAPLPADEYMLYQTLVGAWPLDLAVSDEEGIRALAARICEWQTKSLREAKQRSSWIAPEDGYENACNGFLYAILDAKNNSQTLLELAEFVKRIGPAGAVNSLGQTLLRLTVPGVPDLYQGTEFWDFSLVDPDNRRPVDYPLRRAAFDVPFDVAALVDNWRGGQIKFEVVRRALQLRVTGPDLFREGRYVPLDIEGPAAGHAFAFARQYRDRVIVVIVPHLVATMVLGTNDEPRAHIAPDKWDGTVVRLPPGMAPASFVHVLTGKPCALTDGKILLADALADLPVALLA